MSKEIDISSSVQRKVILVTGASTGLGLAIAKKLIKEDQWIIVLTAKKKSLHRFKEHRISTQENIWLRSMDLTDPRQMSSIVCEINRKLGGVDILINNAGIAERSAVEDTSEKNRKQQVDLWRCQQCPLTALQNLH